MRSTSREAREAAYAEFVTARQAHLRRLAYALCGDWQRADEVLDRALTKLYVAWSRLEREGTEESYVRRQILRTTPEGTRRSTRQPRPEPAPALVEALRELPLRQRKAVLLRHWLGLTVEQTADELGITPSSARHQSERGLAALHDAVIRESR
jgi:DNA-directed RNA polymerase specialized sigma24 family protein